MNRLNLAVAALSILIVVLAASLSPGADQAAETKKSADLRAAFEKWGLGVRAQGGRGTCSVFAISAVIEYAVATRQQRGTRLSVEFLNWASNDAMGDPTDGGCFSELWAGFAAHGVCPETDMPYQPGYDPALRPSKKALEEAEKIHDLGLQFHWIKEWDSSCGASPAQLAEIKRALSHGWPVCGGFLWPKNEGPLWKNGVLNICPRGDVMDGHSILLVGFRDDKSQPGGGVFLIRNSAGGNDAMMSYEYVLTYMNDAAWIDFAGANDGGLK